MEADSCSTISEPTSITTIESSSSSSSGYHDGGEAIRNRGGRETRPKVKKLRSIKLTRLPSLRFATRQTKLQPDNLSFLSNDAASSHISTPLGSEMSGASPNYMKNTSCSSAKESLQASFWFCTNKVYLKY
ncbi:hypothetical protein Tsubulata_045814 [Turnera subulata]|uniref:Uncharacterized protein n=1 Tax=Turnera subulata TaxID=218843 RepID=A0A9Q0GC64_9ROSI|nr:hypothetical protein Tsubulata_045814 [Turnera subulata]